VSSYASLCPASSIRNKNFSWSVVPKIIIEQGRAGATRAVGLYPASLRYAGLNRKRLSPSGDDPSRIILCAQTRAVSAFAEATAD
jgi:hypothetical protein